MSLKKVYVLFPEEQLQKIFIRSYQNLISKKIKILLSDDRLVDNYNELSNYKMIMDTLKLNYCKEFPLSYYDELINNNESKLEKKTKLNLD